MGDVLDGAETSWGTAVAALSSSPGGASLRMPSVPAIGPGEMEFTRMPSPPHSSARTLVSWSSACLGSAGAGLVGAHGDEGLRRGDVDDRGAGLGEVRVGRAHHVEGADEVDVDNDAEAVR